MTHPTSLSQKIQHGRLRQHRLLVHVQVHDDRRPRQESEHLSEGVVDVRQCLGRCFETGESLALVQGDVREADDLRVLDYDGSRAFKLFRFDELGTPQLQEPSSLGAARPAEFWNHVVALMPPRL